MSMLVDHARRELELIGQFKEDPEFAQSLVAAVAAFDSYPGHSGGSHGVAVSMLHELLQLNNLGALTKNPDEWIEVEHSLWQNKRNGRAFSKDGGKTYYNIEDPKNENDDLPIYIAAEYKA